MTDRDWQRVVLRDLGVTLQGLASTAAAPPQPAPSVQPGPVPPADPTQSAQQGPAQQGPAQRQQPAQAEQPQPDPAAGQGQQPPVAQAQRVEQQAAGWYPQADQQGPASVPDQGQQQAAYPQQGQQQGPGVGAQQPGYPPPDQAPHFDRSPTILDFHRSSLKDVLPEPSGQAPGGAPSAPALEPPPIEAPQPIPYGTGPAQAEMPLQADGLLRRSAHGDPLVRRLSSGVRKAVGAAGQVREQAELAQVLARPVSNCRQIAVVSLRGGAGKTTVAALTARAVADHRDDRVLAVDADQGLGSLGLRLGVHPQYTLHDVAAATVRGWEQGSALLSRGDERLWVLPGSLEGRLTAELDLATFRTAYGSLGRYFSTALVDCGAGLLNALTQGVLETAHAQILVTPGTVDGAVSARGALDWYTRNGKAALLERTVVVLVTHSPHADADLDRVRDTLGSDRLPVLVLPYDRHLAAGTAVDAERLGAATAAAAARIAAEAFGRATGAY